MVVTNCSYTPALVLALPEDMEPLSKSHCPFLGQPQPCVLVRPRSPQLAQSEGLRRKREVMVRQAGQGVRQRPPVQDLLQEHTAASAPSRSPSHTAPGWVLAGEFSPVCMNSRYNFFASCAVLSMLVSLPG